MNSTCAGNFPRVTIAIPTYNRVDYLMKAVKSALAQTYPDIEVIVSDNASDDNTQEKLGNIKDQRLVVLRQETNVGMGGNWNTCLRNATGKYFILLSDDDFLEPEAIGKMMEPIINEWIPQEEIGIVYCQTRIINDVDGKVATGPSAPKIESGLDMVLSFFIGKRSIFPCGTLLRTSDILDLDGYDMGKYFYALDAAVWMQIAIKRGHVIYIEQVISNYIIHSENLTTQTKLNNWITGLELLVCTCYNYYININDRLSANRIKKAGKKFIAKFILNIINMSLVKGLTRTEALLQLLSFYKYYFIANYVLIWLKSILILIAKGIKYELLAFGNRFRSVSIL